MKDPLLRSLFIFNGIFVLAASLLGPLYAVYVLKLGQGVIAVSTSWSIFLVATTIGTYIISRFKDGTNREIDMLRSGFVMRAFVWLMYGFIHTLPQLIFLQILLGVGEAFGSPAFNALFAEHLEKHEHIHDYADWQIVSNIMTAKGTFVGGFVVAWFGFRFLFLGMAAFALISFVGFCLQSNRQSNT